MVISWTWTIFSMLSIKRSKPVNNLPPNACLGYNIIIFGGIDGFSRKIMYLEPATNNRSSTALSFFLQSVQKHGWPSRVRADEGVENVAIAETMFRVNWTGRGSFISWKSVHNQRIKRLTRCLAPCYSTVLRNTSQP